MWIFLETNWLYLMLVSWDLSHRPLLFFDAVGHLNCCNSMIVISQKRIVWVVVREQISYIVSEVNFIMCLWKVENRSCVL